MTSGREVLSGPPEEAALWLLGAHVEAGGVTIRVSEVEAYAGQGEDAASHAHRGVTPRTAVMFGPPGFLYVYFTYGMHWCMNVVSGQSGRASAVLLRAGRVEGGVELARGRRGEGIPERDLARGPARLAQALGVDGAATGLDLFDPASPVRLNLPSTPASVYDRGPRVGVSAEAERPWRFWIPGDPTVSVYKRSSRADR